MSTRKTPGTARKQAAADRCLTATRQAQPACDGQDQDETLQATISRLRAERDQDCEAGRSQGRTDGAEWAHSASLANLRRVCEAEEVIEDDDLLALLSEGWGAYYLDNLGEDFDRPSFMRGYPVGFQDGAVEVWRLVKSKL
jgi:hypothetical protein